MWESSTVVCGAKIWTFATMLRIEMINVRFIFLVFHSTLFYLCRYVIMISSFSFCLPSYLHLGTITYFLHPIAPFLLDFKLKIRFRLEIQGQGKLPRVSTLEGGGRSYLLRRLKSQPTSRGYHVKRNTHAPSPSKRRRSGSSYHHQDRFDDFRVEPDFGISAIA